MYIFAIYVKRTKFLEPKLKPCTKEGTREPTDTLQMRRFPMKKWWLSNPSLS